MFIIIFLVIINYYFYAIVALNNLLIAPLEDYSKIPSVILLLFWAFLGWENLSFLTEEFKNPEKNIPIIYWGSFIFISSLYLLLALVVSGANFSGLKLEGASAFYDLFSDNILLKHLVGFFILIAIIANTNAWIIGSNNLLISFFTNKIFDDKNKTPENISIYTLLILVGVYISVIIFIKAFKLSLSNIISMVSQNFLILYFISILAFIKYYKKYFHYLIALIAFLLLLFITNFSFKFVIFPLFLIIMGCILFLIVSKNKDKN